MDYWLPILTLLQAELPSQSYNTWLKPLKINAQEDLIMLEAPNKFFKNWVEEKYLTRIKELVREYHGAQIRVLLQSTAQAPLKRSFSPISNIPQPPSHTPPKQINQINFIDTSVAKTQPVHLASGGAIQNNDSRQNMPNGLANRSTTYLKSNFTFDNFVKGKSNEQAWAAAQQVVENPGYSYNPLFIYGGVGLGKTHLMHAVGAALLERDPQANIVYSHSERFVTDMVKALQLNAMSDFKRFYRSADVLLIDDIQFLAGKDHSQEEFFHTFNALMEGGQQMILTCDRYPKEVEGLEERLKSRFGWGLPVTIDPPGVETRVAILQKKAMAEQVTLSYDAAFFLAERIRSNVRELEGALKRVIANARFTGAPIDAAFVQETLKDLLALQDKQVSINNIQKTVANYYKMRVADILSKRRTRSVARPRQLAMALAKELTSHSYPEIGDAFGGRDHTTVLHACRKVQSLRDIDREVDNDYTNLYRTLTV